MRRLVVGCGYLGMRVAQAWLAEGDEVYVTTRSLDRAGHLARAGLRPLVGDVTRPASFSEWPEVDTLLWAVGYDRRAGQGIREVYVEGLRYLLADFPDCIERCVYISSTGVYGEVGGEWVDEMTPCRPQRAGGQACWEAEQLWLNSRWSDRVVILRLAGIYGPGRLPRASQLLAGQPLDAAPDGLINLIHVDDAADVVRRVAEWPLELPRVYVVADAEPVVRRAFYQELARQLDAPEPEYASATEGAPRLGRSGGHKRVSNRRMLEELRIELRYPSYREGLAMIARQPPGGKP